MTEKNRRNPSQPRAQATVEAIEQASFQILEAEGLAKLTTNRVAERAGVSIGTLYQYFADRDAILASLGQQQAEKIRQKITDILLKAPHSDSVRVIVQTVMQGLEGSPETNSILSDALIRKQGQAVLTQHHLAFLDSISGRAEYDFALGRESAFILTHVVTCLLRAANAQPGLALSREALEDELVLLMHSYLIALDARARKQASGSPERPTA